MKNLQVNFIYRFENDCVCKSIQDWLTEYQLLTFNQSDWLTEYQLLIFNQSNCLTEYQLLT